MRDSQYRSCAAQNQFTAYLLAAIRNYKRTYLKKYTDTMLLEQSLERYTEASELSGETDLFSGLFSPTVGKWTSTYRLATLG